MGKPRKSVGRHKRAGGLLEPWATNGEDRLSQTRGLLERFTKRIIVRVSKEVNIEQPEHWKVRPVQAANGPPTAQPAPPRDQLETESDRLAGPEQRPSLARQTRHGPHKCSPRSHAAHYSRTARFGMPLSYQNSVSLAGSPLKHKS